MGPKQNDTGSTPMPSAWFLMISPGTLFFTLQLWGDSSGGGEIAAFCCNLLHRILEFENVDKNFSISFFNVKSFCFFYAFGC